MFHDLCRTTQLKKKKWEDTTGHPPTSHSFLSFHKEKSIVLSPLQTTSLFYSRGGFRWSDSVSNWSRHENGTQFWPMGSQRKLTLGLLDRLASFFTKMPCTFPVSGCSSLGLWYTGHFKTSSKREGRKPKNKGDTRKMAEWRDRKTLLN